jgi:magnesium transporter
MLKVTNQINSISVGLSNKYLFAYPKEASRYLEQLSPAESSGLLISQDIQTTRRLLFFMTKQNQERIIKSLPEFYLIELLQSMDVSGCASLLIRTELDERERLLTMLPENFANQVREYMSFGKDVAGSLMEKVSHTFFSDLTVGDVISQFRREKTTPSLYIQLIDRDYCLTGRINIQRLLSADESQTLSSLSPKMPLSVSFLTPKSEIIEIFESSGVDILPVVDAHNHLLGLLYASKVFGALKDEITADIQTMVGASAEERALSPSIFAIKKRLPWLYINLLTAFLAAAVVSLFDGIIAKHVALAVLLPVVAGQSGNAGAQALAVTMRGLAIREISLGHWMTVFFKEASVGLISGIAIAFVCGAIVYLWSHSLGLAAVLIVSMIISVSIACICGALIPICLKKLGQDPAQSSSIILTTFTDVVGFFSFLGIATLLTQFI